jgi:Flp pilus assembly protein TadB
MRTLLNPVSPEDYAITGTNTSLVARKSIVLAVSSGSLALISALAVNALLVQLGPTGIGLGVAVVVCIAYSAPARKIRTKAAALRSEFDLTVAVLLDLVNIQTAGGAGIETALVSAAALGDGWCFDEIRWSLSRAQSARSSFWDGLLDLGKERGVWSLVEVAHSAKLAGEHGAKVRQSLITKAASLRARNLARIEHEANQRTEQMGLPMVILFLSFLVFIGYPAMAQTMGAL